MGFDGTWRDRNDRERTTIAAGDATLAWRQNVRRGDTAHGAVLHRAPRSEQGRKGSRQYWIEREEESAPHSRLRKTAMTEASGGSCAVKNRCMLKTKVSWRVRRVDEGEWPRGGPDEVRSATEGPTLPRRWKTKGMLRTPLTAAPQQQ